MCPGVSSPIIPVPAHRDPTRRSDVVPRRRVQLMGRALEEGARGAGLAGR